jgi:uncharacterized protein YecT (DUF1311 family)
MFAADPLSLQPALAGTPSPPSSPPGASRLFTVSLAAGVLSASILGVALAAWVKPNPPAPPVATQAVAGTPPGQGLRIIVETPPPASPLEVLPELSGGPAMASETTARADRPSFDCRRATTLAEKMVCVDPGLARWDRRLDAAYRKARLQQADPGDLGRAQAAWLAAREQAALASPEALASAYETRVTDLQALAEDPDL